MKSRWQTLVETAAMLAIAGGVLSQVVMSHRDLNTSGGVGSSPPRAAANPGPLPRTPLNLDGAATMGSASAPVAVILYSDFQCPFCGAFERDTMPAFRQQYVDTGKVLFAFREFPLPMHRNAHKAAGAAECAGLQGQFWQMHDALFAHQQALDEASVKGYARTLGVRDSEFGRCLGGETAAKVDRDAAEGRSIDVTGTPAFFIGRLVDGRVTVSKRLSGALPLAVITGAVADALGAGSVRVSR